MRSEFCSIQDSIWFSLNTRDLQISREIHFRNIFAFPGQTFPSYPLFTINSVFLLFVNKTIIEVTLMIMSTQVIFCGLIIVLVQSSVQVSCLCVAKQPAIPEIQAKKCSVRIFNPISLLPFLSSNEEIKSITTQTIIFCGILP